MTPLGGLTSGLEGVFTLPLGDAMSHVVPHDLGHVFGQAFTNHVFMLLVSMVLLMIVLPIAASRSSIVPRGFRNFLEVLMQFIREQVVRPVLGQSTDQFIPILWTFFFTILTANLLGMIPLGSIAAGASGFDARLAHWGGTATGNISITAGLALCGFVLIHVGGMVKPTELTADEQELIADIAPRLQRDGLYFVGLDLIGGKLTEINVTSPTGIRELDSLTTSRPCDHVIEWVEERALAFQS